MDLFLCQWHMFGCGTEAPRWLRWELGTQRRAWLPCLHRLQSHILPPGRLLQLWNSSLHRNGYLRIWRVYIQLPKTVRESHIAKPEIKIKMKQNIFEIVLLRHLDERQERARILRNLDKIALNNLLNISEDNEKGKARSLSGWSATLDIFLGSSSSWRNSSSSQHLPAIHREVGEQGFSWVIFPVREMISCFRLHKVASGLHALKNNVFWLVCLIW